MRVQRRRFHSGVLNRPSRPRPGARFAHALTAFMLLFSIVAPLSTAQIAAAAPASAPAAPRAASAAKPNTPPPLPAPSRVVVAGDFQAAIGCAKDYDKTCAATTLQGNPDGTWTGSFPIPAGRYTFRIVTSSDQDRSLGKGGDPNGGDIKLTVPDGSVGVYFSYNQSTGAIQATPGANTVAFQTDNGAVAAAPAAGGTFEAYLSGQPGTPFSLQVVVDGAPVGSPQQVDPGQSGRVHVVADAAGAISAADQLQPATLTVGKADEGGAPLSGACFAVYAGSNLAGQACDGDDGAEDGSTVIRFPNGAPGRGLTLAETKTPDGQAEAPDQSIQLNPGDNQAQAVAGGGDGAQTPAGNPPTVETPTSEAPAGETPTSEAPVGETATSEAPVTDVPTEAAPTDTVPAVATTATIELVAVDETGAPVPGACYAVDGGAPVCDDAGSGSVAFDLTPGDHTVAETTIPAGFTAGGTSQITVQEGGGSFQIPQTAIPATKEAPQAGSITIKKQDPVGQPLVGSCFNLRPPAESGLAEIDLCDGDGSDADGAADGSITVDNLIAGKWRVAETTAPTGYDLAKAADVVVKAGGSTEKAIVDQQA
ncbi:MAG: SpaA isopeptide-forming pilin-related protein, partial [Thermomicrobiales bacterium]